ncbi:FHA domain-containing protein [Microbacterium sp. cf332]|uniref:FHA domain-containing protein n=1 Tax=Microbacterium sp. cf332 TaxID=1761804 RepID=UPI00088AA41C|nr:FHA domain-containing protein [Microbacterium sp. cf332]SDQ04740.1 Forkhead associated (FHA) domain, binds pSer, pThr, pTyr [Microbacterium sp. cf332]
MRAHGIPVELALEVMALGGGRADPSGAFAALGIVPALAGIAIYVWTALTLTAVFRKTGIETWRAWVPVLNVWELFVLAGMRGWWAAVLAGGSVIVAAVAGLIAGLFAGIALNAGFGGDAGSAAGALAAAAIVPALIWIAFLAFALVIQVRMIRALCRGFGLGTGFVVLGAVLFPVWASIVGWGSARWLGREVAPEAEAGRSDDTAAPRRSSADATRTSASAASAPSAPVFAPPSGDAAAVTGPAVPPAPAPEPISASPWAPPPPPVELEPASSAPQVWSAPPVAPPVAAPVAAPFASAPAAASFASAAPAGADANDDVDDHTVLAVRRAPQTTLALPDGSTVLLSSATVVLGRNPLAPDGVVDAQLVPIDDVSRTVSKTHAMLRQTDSGWIVTDLASTNGVFVGSDAVEAVGPVAVVDVFHLGDAELRLSEAG